MTSRPALFFIAALSFSRHRWRYSPHPMAHGWRMSRNAIASASILIAINRMRWLPAGSIFVDHCAHCHGNDAEGTKKRPSLKSARVQQEATDGDLHWLLVNGNRGQGMPSWVKLGDPQIWQVICYVKSLH